MVAFLSGGIASLAADSAYGQPECDYPATVRFGTVYVEPCSLQRVPVPIYLENTGWVGGFTIEIRTTDPQWLAFDPQDTAVADTVGSRLGPLGWEFFAGIVDPDTPSRLRVNGAARVFDTTGAFLPPGDGLLFTIYFNFDNFMVSDTSQLLNAGLINIADTTGYCIYPDNVIRSYFHVNSCGCEDNPRGDANGNGVVNVLDITFLASYISGVGPSICTLCAGDVNNSCSVNVLDVTFLVNYLTGSGPEPVPCDVPCE